LKNLFLKIVCLAIVLSATGLTGCLGPLEPLGKAPSDKGRVVIRIGSDTGGAEARTIGPAPGSFTKYTLSFFGPTAHDQVDIAGGNSVTAELSPGFWTIDAVGYTGTNGNYTAAAEGSAQVTVGEGELSPVVVVLGPKSTAAGTGTLDYSITVPPGTSGSLVVTTAAGGTVSGGTIPLAAGTANTGTKALAPGQYLARARLEKGGVYAGFTEALHVYAGLISALPARIYTDTDFSEAPAPEQIMASLTGVWYSWYPGIGRLDGYRIGRWEDFEELVVDSGKIALFPAFDLSDPKTCGAGTTPRDDDYFVFYDDTVYGEQEDGSGGNGGWGSDTVFRYIGIFRASNIFDSDLKWGAIIIEYLEGCAPQWDPDLKDGQLPFFGIYYKKTDTGAVQFANPVDLDAMYAGDKYYTETATLQEAINKNTAENDSAFIVWSVVTPSEREQ
jgi:hypothetical protein